jgi:hypothetical protein
MSELYAFELITNSKELHPFIYHLLDTNFFETPIN